MAIWRDQLKLMLQCILFMTALLCWCSSVVEKHLSNELKDYGSDSTFCGIFRAIAFFGACGIAGSYALLLSIHVTVNCFQGNCQSESSCISLVSLFSIC